MLTLQELVARARLLLEGSPQRFAVFQLANGKNSAKDIAKKTKRNITGTLNDLQKMKDLGIADVVRDENGIVKKDNSLVYEKNPVLKHISTSLLKDPTRLPRTDAKSKHRNVRKVTLRGLAIPEEKDILEICKNGEDQIYEFKQAGVETKVLTKEICAFANTKEGGLIFYGIEDDGTISNSDKKKSILDQSIQNSIRSTISPSLKIKIAEKEILGHKILIILVPPWNKKDVYHYDGRVCIRQGTNVFYAKPEESKDLHAGKYII